MIVLIRRRDHWRPTGQGFQDGIRESLGACRMQAEVRGPVLRIKFKANSQEMYPAVLSEFHVTRQMALLSLVLVIVHHPFLDEDMVTN